MNRMDWSPTPPHQWQDDEHVFRPAVYSVAGHWRQNEVKRQPTLFNFGLKVVSGAVRLQIQRQG